MASKMFWQTLSSKWMLVICVIGALSLLWESGMVSFEWQAETSDDVGTGTTKTPIVFLKTHKTGGSAIQNICLRYAIEHDLLIALPRRNNYFGHPQPFKKSMVAFPKGGRQYQVFTHHTRFNYKNIKNLMPKGAVFFTIMREPASLFESAYSYYAMRQAYGMTLEKFVSQDKKAMAKYNDRMPGNGRIGRNQMTFDLGGETENFDNEYAIRQMAETLDQQFQLVMIMERMNESLVLLKHLMSWTTDDVVVLNLNARLDDGKTELTPNLKENILNWNRADVILYEYFSKKFDDKVKAFGEDRMREEVQKLQNRIEEWYSFCVTGVKRDTGKFVVASNIQGFKLADAHNKTCEYLVKTELKFTKEMVKRQAKLVGR